MLSEPFVWFKNGILSLVSGSNEGSGIFEFNSGSADADLILLLLLLYSDPGAEEFINGN